MFKVKKFFSVIFMFLYARTGFYFLRSRVWRWFVEHKYRKGVPAVKTYESIVELQKEAQSWKWEKDSAIEGWDMISYPAATQARIDDPNPAIGDCDDWSMYFVRALDKMLLAESYFLKVGEICTGLSLLSVFWLENETGKAAGHSVCLIEIADSFTGITRYAHMSNWSQASILDAGGTLNSIDAVVSDICEPARTNIGWALADAECKFTGKSGTIEICSRLVKMTVILLVS